MKLDAKKISYIARSQDVSKLLDWTHAKKSKEEVYLSMGKVVVDVVERSENPEDVLTASITHLLVENYCLRVELGLDPASSRR